VRPPPPPGSGLGARMGMVLLGAAGCAWLGARLGTAVAGCPPPAPAAAGALLWRLATQPASPLGGTPASPACPAGRPWFWAGSALSATVAVVLVAAVLRRRPPPGGRGRRAAPPTGSRGAGARRRGGSGRRSGRGRPRSPGRWGTAHPGWARPADLEPLVVRRVPPGRLVLGRAGRRLLAAEARQSLLVVGPTQTLKTSGLAVPALLEWQGPVLATSVKTDLVRDTMAWRRRAGRVSVFDPAGCTGLPAVPWSPLAAAGTWAGARRVASALVAGARSSAGGLNESDFWLATASKLLAPLLFAAATSGRTMADVVRWVDTQETGEVAAALAAAGVEEALVAAEASWGREERQRSSVYTTAEVVLDPFADPAGGSLAPPLDTAGLLAGGHDTVYLCAPAHEQRRLRPLFAALVNEVVAGVYARVTATGRPLDPPLLVVLDEAAAIAPVDDLDELAATGAGQGIQLVTVWQDLAQVAARYGPRAASVVNNHRAKLLLSGVSDGSTLEAVSALVGEAAEEVSSFTSGAGGGRSRTDTVAHRRLAPADALRRIPPGQAVLVYGHLPPALVSLRPWFEEPELGRRVRG